MAFEQTYFKNRKYKLKQQLVERHVLEVLRWATKETNINLLSGEGKRALDVGCAFGYTSKILSQLGYETFGIDISNWGIKQAKTQHNAQFLVCDAQTNLPFNSAAFDLVTCFDVLEHLERPEAALKGIFDVCRSTLVCTTPNKTVEKPIRKLTGDYDQTHINVKSEAQWRKSIKENLGGGEAKFASFLDCPMQFRGKLFFKSFRIPKYGLTVRMAIKK